ncbi:DUF4263 domain-containing protein, partial [Brevibacillus porteri]
MKIYDRDFTKLTQQESEEWGLLEEKAVTHKLGNQSIMRNVYREYPVAVRHYLSLFPNNHLDIVDLHKENELTNLVEQFHKELEKPMTNERSILNFIKENKAHFIIASIMKEMYSFGHHDAFIIPEFQLGNKYQVDYLLIGKNSGGYEFIFVELEHPSKNIILKEGDLG